MNTGEIQSLNRINKSVLKKRKKKRMTKEIADITREKTKMGISSQLKANNAELIELVGRLQLKQDELEAQMGMPNEDLDMASDV